MYHESYYTPVGDRVLNFVRRRLIITRRKKPGLCKNRYRTTIISESMFRFLTFFCHDYVTLLLLARVLWKKKNNKGKICKYNVLRLISRSVYRTRKMLWEIHRLRWKLTFAFESFWSASWSYYKLLMAHCR